MVVHLPATFFRNLQSWAVISRLWRSFPMDLSTSRRPRVQDCRGNE